MDTTNRVLVSLLGFCGSADFPNRSVPRQQVGESVDGMVGDARKNVGKIGFRIELIELGCSD